MFKNKDELIEELNKNSLLNLKIKVSANSRINSIEFLDDFVKIKITTPAIEGRANKAIIEFLSKELKIAKSKIKIMTGEKSSNKLIRIEL